MKRTPQLAALLCAVLFITGCSVSKAETSPAPEPTVSVQPVAETVEDAYNAGVSQLQATAEAGQKIINPARKGFVDTVEVNQGYAELTQMLEDMQNATMLTDWEDMEGSDPQAITDLKSVVTNTVATFTEKSEAWVELVERSRVIPANETPEERVHRIQKETGLILEFHIGECRIEGGKETASGCYNPGDDFYVLTEDAVKGDECFLRKVIAHEHRHYEQWVEGLIEPNMANRDWLETDARANEWRGGC